MITLCPQSQWWKKTEEDLAYSRLFCLSIVRIMRVCTLNMVWEKNVLCYMKHAKSRFAESDFCWFCLSGVSRTSINKREEAGHCRGKRKKKAVMCSAVVWGAGTSRVAVECWALIRKPTRAEQIRENGHHNQLPQRKKERKEFRSGRKWRSNIVRLPLCAPRFGRENIG